MTKSIAFILTLISINVLAEEIKCLDDALLIDYVDSVSKDRIQSCQKRLDTKFVKHGPEIIYDYEGKLKSKKFYKMDAEADLKSNLPTPLPEISTCPEEAQLENDACIPLNGFIWVGRYSCPGFQGETQLKLTMGTGSAKAIFDFKAKNGKGSYYMTGKYDPKTKELKLEPVSWIEKPKNYLMIEMKGTINFEEHTYTGKLTGCANFELKAPQSNKSTDTPKAKENEFDKI